MGEDRRIAGMNPGSADARNNQITQFEDKRLGNISNRVHTVAQMINSVLPPAPGAIGGSRAMVHHSDEAGRPFVTNVDTPVIAFVPTVEGVLTVGAADVGQVKALMVMCGMLGFKVIINAGWRGALGLVGSALGVTGDARGWQPGPYDPARAR